MMLPPTVSEEAAATGAEDAKVVAAFTVRRLLPLLPITVLPNAVKALPAETVTAALAVMGAEKAEVALTVRALLLLEPRLTSVFAVKLALAVMGAVEAKVVTAFTVRL